MMIQIITIGFIVVCIFTLGATFGYAYHSWLTHRRDISILTRLTDEAKLEITKTYVETEIYKIS